MHTNSFDIYINRDNDFPEKHKLSNTFNKSYLNIHAVANYVLKS